MNVLELKTGLFPDADTVASAVKTLDGAQDVTRLDLTGLAPNDEDAWNDVAAKVLAADLIVTL